MTDDAALTAPALSAPALDRPEPASVAGWLREQLLVHQVSSNELAAWGCLLVATLVSRFLFLGSPPLNLDEGRRALEAYTLLREGRLVYESAPILTNLTWLSFTLFADGDLQARLVPAACGVLLVLTPLLLRSAFGGWWSVLAGICLASSTVLLTSSRSLSPTVPMVLCLAVTAISAWRFGIDHERRWLIAVLVSALVGVGVDTSFTVGLIGLILAYAIAEGEIFGRVPWWTAFTTSFRRSIAVAIVVAVVLDTRFMMSPGGIQTGLIDSWWRWVPGVARGAGLTAPLLIGLLDGAIVILAVIGVLEYPRYPRAVRFLATWLLVSMTVAALMRMPDVRYIAPVLLPAGLLAGLGLLRLCSWLVEAGSMRTTVLGLIALVPLVTATFQINAGLRANLSPWGSSGVVLLAGLLLASLLAFNLLRGLELGAAFATWLLVLLAICGLAGAMRALGARGDDRGQLVDQSVVTADMTYVREMALKWYRASPDGPLPVDPTIRPLVAWSLRDVPTVRYDQTAASQPVARLLADPPPQTSPDTMTIRPIVGYAPDWPTFTIQPSRVWRWIMNRESLVTLRPYAIVVVQPAGR